MGIAEGRATAGARDRADESLSESLGRLRADLGRVRLPLELADAPDRERQAAAMAAQLTDYVLPRLANIDAPLLAVVGGSTGAGKSTLVNSLIGRTVSRAGVIRPTTRSPLLVHNPADAAWFTDDRILPGLVRTTVESVGAQSLQLVPEPTLPQGLALLDAPDIDSVVADNRALAGQLLESADLWLFVTSAARYADAVPWSYLTRAAERGAAVAVVCDRVPPEAMREVPADLARLMSAQGLADAPLFPVPETTLDASGLLPADIVTPIRDFLAGLAGNNQRRRQVIAQTLRGAIGAIVRGSTRVADALDEQNRAANQLNADATGAFTRGAEAVSAQSADGTLLRGEVLARWHEYVGTGQITRFIDDTVGRLRDRIGRALRGEPGRGQQAADAASSGWAPLIGAAAEAATEPPAPAWRQSVAGRPLLAEDPQLGHTSADFAARVGVEVRDWQGEVLELVREQGHGRRRTARIAAAGVNGVGAALMLVIFAHTAGLTGAEVGVAGGSAVVAQRLLESIFGDDAVRRLAATAKESLDARVQGLMASELVRFTDALRRLGIDPELAGALRHAAAGADAASAGNAQSLMQAMNAAGAPRDDTARDDTARDDTARDDEAGQQ
ncbi:MAG: ABC transporter [Propionibacterium freudenreichii]